MNVKRSLGKILENTVEETNIKTKSKAILLKNDITVLIGNFAVTQAHSTAINATNRISGS